jgi:hypothetical protein
MESAMTGSKIQSFDLFKAAIGNSEYLTEINKDTTSQAYFIQTLAEGHLTHQNILESIQTVANQKVKSLLIIHLLSQKDYIGCLKGSSLLNRLSTPENHIPSRLNALIHQLDLSTLTTNLISKLEPEAAVSILCSIPHFHQLTKEQTEALIRRYPKHELIIYWINRCASMPNAHYALAHLMKYAGTNIIDELIKMEPNQKDATVLNIIEHLEFFNYLPRKFLELANKESHLILAMRLYLNGHYNKAYAAYINQLTKKLLDKNHSFSSQAIELLFLLNDKLAFNELAHKTAYLTNCYVRNNAQEGTIALFYQNNQINIQRVIQDVILDEARPKQLKEQTQAKTIVPNVQNKLESSHKNPLLEGLIKHNKSVNCLEYFLIHYKGSVGPLSKVLNDYMDFYGRAENAKNRSKAIHHLGFMLTRPELDTSVKEALFTAFLNHPAFFDEQISPQLFLFNAKRAIRHFGLLGGEKNYRIVIGLCMLALKKLHPDQNKEIIQFAQKALFEAKQELNFSQEQGLFSGLIKRIKRCWVYGWTGFFKPNTPRYVVPESQKQKAYTKRTKKDIELSASKKDLPTLLDEMECPLTKSNFEDIIEALNLYSVLAIPKDELATREKLQALYHQAMENNSNKELYCWLKENQNPFIINQFRLLELTLKEKQRKEVDSLMVQINEDSDQLEYIADELNCIMPELIVKDIPKSKKDSESADFVASTTKVLSEYVCEASGYAQSALGWAENWANRFFDKMTKPKEDDDVFEVEHVTHCPPTSSKV